MSKRHRLRSSRGATWQRLTEVLGRN